MALVAKPKFAHQTLANYPCFDKSKLSRRRRCSSIAHFIELVLNKCYTNAAKAANCQQKEQGKGHQIGDAVVGDLGHAFGVLPEPPNIDQRNNNQPGRRDTRAQAVHLQLSLHKPDDAVNAERDNGKQNNGERVAMLHGLSIIVGGRECKLPTVNDTIYRDENTERR